MKCNFFKKFNRSTCIIFQRYSFKQTNTWIHGSKCSNLNGSVAWIIFSEIINLRVKYTHLRISYFHEKSTNIWREYFIYLHIVDVMLYFSMTGFFYVNLDNVVLWCLILQGSFVQLTSTLIKSYYRCAYFLSHYQHYYYQITAPQCPPKTEQIAVGESDPWFHYCSFAFCHCLTALELMLATNERTCYYYYH